MVRGGNAPSYLMATKDGWHGWTLVNFHVWSRPAGSWVCWRKMFFPQWTSLRHRNGENFERQGLNLQMNVMVLEGQESRFCPEAWKGGLTGFCRSFNGFDSTLTFYDFSSFSFVKRWILFYCYSTPELTHLPYSLGMSGASSTWVQRCGGRLQTSQDRRFVTEAVCWNMMKDVKHQLVYFTITITGWWWLEDDLYFSINFHILGMSSSQLTNSYFSEG